MKITLGLRYVSGVESRKILKKTPSSTLVRIIYLELLVTDLYVFPVSSTNNTDLSKDCAERQLLVPLCFWEMAALAATFWGAEASLEKLIGGRLHGGFVLETLEKKCWWFQACSSGLLQF